MTEPEIRFDDRLRDVPADLGYARTYIAHLRSGLTVTQEPTVQVSLLGEIGVWLRILSDLQGAEETLSQAIALVRAKKLGIAREVQQRIRLAHVWQWQERFEEATSEFRKLIAICERESQARPYLDFAWQHAGKNFFDQTRLAEALRAFEEALCLRKERGAPREQIESTELAICRTRLLLAAQ